MKILVKETCSGDYRVSYDIGKCYNHWKLNDAPLSTVCTFCLLNDGIAGTFDSEGNAKEFASSLPKCGEPLRPLRADKLSTSLF
ncbi:MAG: hypothetical protein IH874_00435 [Candidatus Dadabacteria bacterium]|nr:hypothetical protein [Candidatus Dadabacteria bacterium]